MNCSPPGSSVHGTFQARILVVVVQLRSCVWLFATPRTAAHQASPSFTISWSFFKLTSFESVMRSNHLILCHPLLLLPSIFCSIRVFSNELLFTSGGQSMGASASVLPMNIQGLFPLGLTDLISLQSKWLSRVFSNTTVQSISSSVLSLLYSSTLTSVHDYWKNHSFDYRDLFWGK